MEPWLDSLSEDWEAEKHSTPGSLPTVTPRHSDGSSIVSPGSQSRIPRAGSQSLKGSSARPRYLKTRRGGPTHDGPSSPVLVEHSSSKLNVAAQRGSIPRNKSQGIHTSIPRRVSSVFSDISSHSVQYHTVELKPSKTGAKGDTPEWKKRLIHGEIPSGAQSDLFGPTRLEGIFKPTDPTSKTRANDPLPHLDGLQTPWALPGPPAQSSRHGPQAPSMRASLVRAPNMEALQEEDEDMSGRFEPDAELKDENTQEELNSEAPDDESQVRHSPQLNQPEGRNFSNQFPNIPPNDPRLRTVSGQEEVRNEDISPIPVSRMNTINGTSKTEAQGVVEYLQYKLEQVTIEDRTRPSSRSSDRNVQYGHGSDGAPADELFDLTSHSLPDDLSMGTADFASHGGFVSTRRGGYSKESSFHKRPLSPSSFPPSHDDSAAIPSSQFRSSPPPYVSTKSQQARDEPLTVAFVPTTPSRSRDHKKQEETSSPSRQKSSGSPLKLFGNHDTFTNNKLIRRMSQWEENFDVEVDKDGHIDMKAASERLADIVEQVLDVEQGSDNDNPLQMPEDLKMSQFGLGQLDEFSFVERVSKKVSVTSKHEMQNDLGLLSTWQRTTQTRQQVPRNDDQDRMQKTETSTVEGKRMPNSPRKESTPKRRLTLQKAELQAHLVQEIVQSLPDKPIDPSLIAGRKRKDARYEGSGAAADPKILAMRQMLRPRTPTPSQSSTSQRSVPTLKGLKATSPAGFDVSGQEEEEALQEVVVEDLARITDEARKRSMTTADWFQEAATVMNHIRAQTERQRHRSRDEYQQDSSSLADDFSLPPDESTAEPFSRPPSRERVGVPKSRDPSSQDPRVVRYLRKFEERRGSEEEELDFGMGPSSASLHLGKPNAVKELVLVQEEEFFEGSPANIRIRKRKHSTVTSEGDPSLRQGNTVSTHGSSDPSTGRSMPTSSTTRSGPIGNIPPEKASKLIPDKVGGMSFDHNTRTWVRGKQQQSPGDLRRGKARTSEDDPFDDIPDLSVDEMAELEKIGASHSGSQDSQPKDVAVHDYVEGNVTEPSSRPQTREGAQTVAFSSSSAQSKHMTLDSSCPKVETRATSWGTDAPASKARTQAQTIRVETKLEQHTEEVEHEIRIHEGRISQVPSGTKQYGKQPRVVTIAFSSPLVSAIAYQSEDGQPESHSPAFPHVTEGQGPSSEDDAVSQYTPMRKNSARKVSSRNVSGRTSFDAKAFPGRPVSRIDEQDEDNPDLGMSVVHVSSNHHVANTPKATRSQTTLVVPSTHGKPASLLCLTPLSEFTVQQIDETLQFEASYVEERVHPNALRQAHGSLTLAVDDLMRAVTDAEPSELYWEHIRDLQLKGKRLTSLHRLQDYCSHVETLDISDNAIRQLSGVPPSVRTLTIRQNQLSSLTSWTHLQNLQYLDLSGNQLESLEGLSSLVHLRELKAEDNRIRNIDGVFDLDALLTLKLGGNELASVDFESAEL